ncbi:VOC family protein [Caldanaerobius polysaccharolyticus]|uniref:VOC family protein n=1 Tax=Caldanaerobius polysaccharolyticus TaxID=44256 RepID=UPI00068AF7B3|nr:VOC family protein [Caldanaerobius polysaccharolyticus]
MSKIDSNVICQIAIVVKDIEAAARNYSELFGMEMPEIFTVPPAEEVPVYYHGKLISPKAKICIFQMGPIVLELTEPGEGPSSWREFLERHGQGVHHIGIEVQNLDNALNALKKVGADVIQVGYYPTSSYWFMDSEDQLGVRVNIKHGNEDNSDKVKKHTSGNNA